MSVECDAFDPNNWPVLWDREWRLYAGTLAQYECLVDEEDWHYFTQWQWSAKVDPTGKIYFRRAISTYDLVGKRLSSETVYLHIEILTLAQGSFPTKKRCIADHWNGNSLDNRRENLRWATKRENNRNRFGVSWYQRSFA